MSKSFVQVPPQSTGKKLATEFRKEVHYDTLTGGFNIGDVIVGETSGASGVVTAIDTDDSLINEGVLYLKEFVGNFVNNENLMVNNISQALANIASSTPQIDYDMQKFVLTDPDNLSHNQKIDRFGASINTFTDGSPLFGPFGTLSVGEPQVVKEYSFLYDKKDALFYDLTTAGGTITYEAAKSSVLLSTGTGATDKAQRTTNYYHPYHPGVGTSLEFTLQLGDNGKTNVLRRWGLFDDNNGLYFELDGTQLSVVVRTNSTDGSTVTETRISQEQFNVDRLDGTDSINFSLDFTKGNIFWIDYQWLGAGKIRFGVYEPSGQRITAHVIENTNTNSLYPYTRTPNLPLRISQENTGSVISTSEMRFACAVVKHTSNLKAHGDKHTQDSGLKTIATADGEVPIVSIRPKQLHEGIENRSIIRGISITLSNATSSNNLVVFRMRTGNSNQLTGASWTPHSGDSVTEADVAATLINTTNTHVAFTVSTNNNNTLFLQDIAPKETKTFELFLHGDAVTQPMFCITAQSLNGTNADVFAAINWEELYH